MSASLVHPRAIVSGDRLILAAVWAAALGTIGALINADQWSSIPLFLVAVGLGAVFLLTRFGFNGAFRAFLNRGDGAELSAGLLIAAIAALVIIPVSAAIPGYSGFVAPLGLPLIGGAALFGIGMQLGNGCGSGTICHAGGGSRRMWVTIPFFALGGVLGTLILPASLRLPAFAPIGFSDWFGSLGGLITTLALLAALAAVLLRRSPMPSLPQLRTAAIIGILAALAFLFSGQPWGVTMGLTLWGAKFLTVVNADFGNAIAQSEFWNWDGARQALTGPILAQDSSLMDIGVILGAALVAAHRGSFRRQPWPAFRGIIASAIGGLLMGFGGRLSFGCNIGALIGGISSGSLHGFVWLLAAMPGCWIGIRLRPLAGLSRE